MDEKLPIILLLLVLSFIDIKKREVPHLGVLALFLYALFFRDISLMSLFWCAYCFIGLGVAYMVTRGGIGGGDIKLLASLAFCLGSFFPVYLGCLAVVSGVGFLAGYVYYKNLSISLPFVPIIFMAYLLFSLI